MRCIICSLHLVNKMHIFRRSTYGDNPKLDCALHQRDVQDGSVICQNAIHNSQGHQCTHVLFVIC